MARVLTARATARWQALLLAVLVIIAHLVVGLLVVALRIARVVVTVAASAAVHAEQQLSTRTGRTALSHIGIAVFARALTAEFLTGVRTAYRAPAR